jgi:hypothetical protein
MFKRGPTLALVRPAALCMTILLQGLFVQIAVAQKGLLDISKATILVDSTSTLTEQSAAKELGRYLSQITGKEIPIATDAKLRKNCIVVGSGPLIKMTLPHFDPSKLASEQIVVRSVGSRLVVTGGGTRGTMYAVYRLLQQKCGVRWWAPWATTVPIHPHLKLANLDISEKPAFEYREPYWSHTNNGDWAVHNFSNGASIQVDDSRGGKTTYQGFVHTYYPLVPPAQYFKAHPEWYSLIDGKRTTEDAQLCTTNPELRKFIVEQVRAQLKANPQVAIISVSQNDCFRPCQCDVCRALVKQEGSESALVLDLVNYVADQIKDEFPNVAVDTLAYQWSRHPTKAMKPRPNVIVRLCSIECNFAHPLSDPVNNSFGVDIRGWNKLTNRLYVWDYCTNFAHYLQPQPDYFALGPTLAWFSQNGVKGVFEEGDYTSSGGDMAELKAWLIAQMLWDPKQDPNALVDEFLKGYYGPAAAPIKQYLELMTAEAQATHVSFALDSNAPFLRYEVMAKARKLWDRAKALVGHSSEFSARVKMASLSPESIWLTRWQEFRAAAQKAGDEWPLESTKADASARWLSELQSLNLPGCPKISAMDEGGTAPQKFVESLGP